MTTHPLTPRQLEACSLYAQGLFVWEVALRMGVSRCTVVAHLEAARERMGARHLGQLMAVLAGEVTGQVS